jgi:hypothetical protein
LCITRYSARIKSCFFNKIRNFLRVPKYVISLARHQPPLRNRLAHPWSEQIIESPEAATSNTINTWINVSSTGLPPRNLIKPGDEIINLRQGGLRGRRPRRVQLPENQLGWQAFDPRNHIRQRPAGFAGGTEDAKATNQRGAQAQIYRGLGKHLPKRLIAYDLA